MNSRSRVLLTLVLAFALGACASSGGTTTPDAAEPANNASGRTFPPGTEPSRNVWTRSAQIYLDEAENADAVDIREENYTEALVQARLSIQNQPNNPLGYYQAGISLIGLQQWEEAGQMLDRAEELYPRYALEIGPRRQNAWIGLYNQAVQAVQANDEPRAIELMLLADQIFQDRPEARSNLAILYTNQADYENALLWYERTLETLRGEEREYISAEMRADWAEQESDIVFNMAQLYQRLGRRADAIRLYREYLATNPDDATVKTQLALALAAEGQDAEAATLFNEILSVEGLPPEDYYEIGIGLFNANRFEDAARAFDRAATGNPYFRDAIFNLSQALLAHANARNDADAPDSELIPIYERLITVGDQIRQADPYSRTAALVLASAYRSLAEMTSGATSNQWRQRLLGQLELLEDMPFDITEVNLRQTAPGRLQMSGQLTNLTMAPGTPVQLRATILGPGGTTLATQDITVTAPDQEASTRFSADFQVQGEIAGWRYERIE